MAGTALSAESPFRPRVYPAVAAIWGIGTLPDCVYRLQTGRVNIVSIDAAGNELLLRVVGPGETFGEVCFCAHRTEPHYLIARSMVRCEIVKASYHEFRRSLRSDVNFMEAVVAEFCTRLADLEEKAQTLALHDATQRLSRLLVHLARSRGTQSKKRSTEFTLMVSHSELAAMSALTRPHVSLLMTQFRERGWVSYQRGMPLKVYVGKIPAG